MLHIAAPVWQHWLCQNRLEEVPAPLYVKVIVSDPHSLYADQDLYTAFETNVVLDPDPNPNPGKKVQNFFQSKIKFYVFIKLSHIITIYTNVIVSNILIYNR
jgi:hypothetical protein